MQRNRTFVASRIPAREPGEKLKKVLYPSRLRQAHALSTGWSLASVGRRCRAEKSSRYSSAQIERPEWGIDFAVLETRRVRKEYERKVSTSHHPDINNCTWLQLARSGDRKGDSPSSSDTASSPRRYHRIDWRGYAALRSKGGEAAPAGSAGFSCLTHVRHEPGAHRLVMARGAPPDRNAGSCSPKPATLTPICKTAAAGVNYYYSAPPRPDQSELD